MEFTYAFSGKTKSNKPVTGLLQAESADLAFNRVRRMGFVKHYIRFDVFETIRTGFGASINQRELARFYGTVGRRLNNNGSLIDALEGALDYIDDRRLKSAVAILRTAIEDGAKLHAAMLSAGFAHREAMVVRALSEFGETGKAFLDLSAEIADNDRLANSIHDMLRMLRYTLYGVWLFLPGLFGWLAPQMNRFFAKAGKVSIKMPEGVAVFYQFAGWVTEHPILSIGLWVSMPVLVIMLLRSRLTQRILNQVRIVHQLTTKSEHAQLWTGYALMYGAGIPPAEICKTLSTAVKLEATQDGLIKLSKRIQGGDAEDIAIEQSGFPRFVISGFKAAKKSGSLEASLMQFTGMLREDVAMLTAKLRDTTELLSKLVLGGVVVVVFMLALYPVLAPIISSF